jgi:hypothetical protein
MPLPSRPAADFVFGGFADQAMGLNVVSRSAEMIAKVRLSDLLRFIGFLFSYPSSVVFFD